MTTQETTPISTPSSQAPPEATMEEASFSTAGAPTRQTYVLQYSPATQMILNRIRGRRSSASISPAIPSSPLPTPSPAALEETKRRLLQTMKSSDSTIAMPSQITPSRLSPSATSKIFIPPPRPHSSTPVSVSCTSKTVSQTGNILKFPKSSYTAPYRAVVDSSIEPKFESTPILPGDAELDSARSLQSRADADFSEEDMRPQLHAPAQISSSRGQTQKSTSFIPLQLQPGRRKAMTKRIEAQAMCSLCQRLASTEDNQIVFCDACNDAWHQKCANPMIPRHVVATDIPWFCARCQGLKLPYIGPNDGLVAWEHRNFEDRQAYLSTIPQPMLVSLLTKSLEIQPSLPIFPAYESIVPPSHTRELQGSREAALPISYSSDKNQSYSGSMNITASTSRLKIATSSSWNSTQRRSLNGTNMKSKEPEIDMNLMTDMEGGLRWPKHGGQYMELPPDQNDTMMEDADDYEAFSVVEYNQEGQKMRENGRIVLSEKLADGEAS